MGKRPSQGQRHASFVHPGVALITTISLANEPLSSDSVHSYRWQIYSVDPLMVTLPESLGRYESQLHPVKLLLEDWEIPRLDGVRHVLILSVHNHAPLEPLFRRCQRFYPNVHAITLPCCGHYGYVSQAPVVEYDDNEVVSASKRLYIYSSCK